MVKTKKTAKKTIITKKNNQVLKLQDYLKSFYKFNTFTKKISTKTSLIYLATLFVILIIVNLLKSLTPYVSLSITETLTISLIGIPLLLFLIFGIFYIILNAFENKRKPFFESLLVFSSMGLSYIVIGHILTLIQLMIYNSIMVSILNILTWVVIIYFIVAFILNFKNYYGTSGYRVFVSFFFIDIIIAIFSIVYYFQMILLKAGV